MTWVLPKMGRSKFSVWDQDGVGKERIWRIPRDENIPLTRCVEIEALHT